MFCHPVVFFNKWAKLINSLTTNNIDKKALCLIEVWDGETNVLGAS
jgi:hypothetical protein